MGLFDLFTGTKRPAAGTPVLPAGQLRERLQALNRPTAPWRVLDGKADNVDLIAEWKVDDPAFREHFHKANSSKVFRVYLKLDEAKHEVRASDREYIVEWSRENDLLSVKLSLSVSGFKGQKQEVSFGGPPAYTETLPSGETVGYKFGANELKKPVQEAVTGGGWTYQGVAFGKL